MRQVIFTTILIIVSFGVGIGIWAGIFATSPDGSLLHTMYKGGPLVVALIALLIMLFGFIIERAITLYRVAAGKSSVQAFFKKVINAIQANDFETAIAACDKQKGTVANILRAGIERYNSIKHDSTMSHEKKISETQRAIEEANALEVPLLERNLIALSTIASIATMVGLLGTTIGMIRAFAATGKKTGGVINAEALATGISEALVNTAGGLSNAIIGIVAYNFFVNKVDAFNYTIDEASYEVVQLLKDKEGK
ncbi:MAG TPA: flagellar motor protein MotA [candidate division Zixibacteria bacterium]|nr:flagellar motor protein MotA [candidate division Zixibacteria bacterium]HBZ00044.1 flagellar motor protein MotA [candidate division Zixibacteria bacterium]